MEGDNRLRERTGIAPRLIEGPGIGQRSLYHQQVLDEDSYTDALSHIITRDFFPNLPHIHATNAYLSALTNNDPELLSSSIRRLAQIAQDKESGVRGSRANVSRDEQEAAAARAAELRNMGTPYISLPGRTPVGARGWDTPMYDRDRGASSRGGGAEGLSMEIGEIAGSSKLPARKKRRLGGEVDEGPRVRDDLSLDAFQRNYTSEDNASFVQIVAHENKQRAEERWGWAWEAQHKAEQRRLEGEQERKMILDAALEGRWKVDADGKRMIGGLAEGGRDRAEGEAWRETRTILPADEGGGGRGEEVVATDAEGDNEAGALVKHASSGTSAALITAREARKDLLAGKSDTLDEVELPENHPLGRALAAAGLPTTALVSKEDGVLVPLREATSGAGEGRGRGDDEKDKRRAIEKAVMGDDERPNLSLGGSGADQWGYKARNNFFFPADADVAPYPKISSARPLDKALAAPPSISHANTRLRDEEEVGPAGVASSTQGRSSRRGSSPARSWVDAAVRGTPYVQRDQRSGLGLGAEESGPMIGDYPLVATDPSPAPEALPSLLTWGTLLATPRALDGGGTDDPLDSTPSFRLPQTRRRDELARKLGDKASRSMHERAKGFTPRAAGSSLSQTLRAAAERTRGGGGTGGRTPATTTTSAKGKGSGAMLPPDMGTPRRSDALTPAAKRLLERSMGRTPGREGGGGAFGSGGSSALTLGLGSSARGRAAAMEKGSGWGGGSTDSVKKRMTAEMSWTPSPARQKEM